MKRRYAHGRRIRIRQGYLGWLERFIKELRGLLDDRDSKIRAIEGRLRKVEARNIELMSKFLDAQLSVRTGDFVSTDSNGRKTVWKNEMLEVRLHFNHQTYPNTVWDSVSDFARLADVLANLIRNKFEKIEEPTPDQMKKFERLTDCGCTEEDVRALVYFQRSAEHKHGRSK